MSKTRAINRGNFPQYLEQFMADITTIEIKTIVVDEIVEKRFISWEAYREIYLISQEYLNEIGISDSLKASYLSLKEDLEKAYLQIVKDSQSDFYEPKVTNLYLLDKTKTSMLPSPLNESDSDHILKIERLLKYPPFVLTLRRITEYKNILDQRNQKIKENPNYKEDLVTDFVSAQTIIQLDGHITNRYPQRLLNHPQKETLLQFHHYGVECGMKTWQALWLFILKLIWGEQKQ